ncbi:nucleic acid binding OB-fold tRNA/helicase-type [Methanocaldococcus vulcanius M7]|uniref:Nucleic acid binding OB-fold tRNA/helicase-type n=1 Tax=Methanocaldococcus vulcanius (strain ATCC 700851 / DSM 12094 / M7) TaxID=579137 RepID=C9REI6_METVM|nr:OB-fold nucleic acid binding domain-containing protein [Methanocaldococcus vulcanius]ACX71988.1 nucleic acid binding OB-fold tRNA/helicase-type [Methanocaldococcus vulcanius M7]
MKLNEKNVMLFALTCFIVVSTVWLFLNPIQPIEKHVSDVKEGDYVIIKGYIQEMDVKRDKYRHVIGLSRLVINDGTGNIDVVAFGKTKTELLNYILQYTPMIKEGDYVEVRGKVSVYRGLYEVILDKADDFKLLKKNNFDRDIFLSPTPTSIYASIYGKKYHTLDNCPYGKRLKKENIIYFYSEEDAKALGYEKCKWCKEHEN